MAQTQEKQVLDVDLHEYDKLKDEQIQRIGFRDNILYVNLVSVGAVASYAVSGENRLYALLLIPWVCTILGWTYLVNDEKISALGRYIRLHLEERIRRNLGTQEGELFGWETFHRSDEQRMQRKYLQLFVDLLTFCIIGIVCIGVFLALSNDLSPLWVGVSLIEAALLIVLGYQIFVYADLRKGR